MQKTQRGLLRRPDHVLHVEIAPETTPGVGADILVKCANPSPSEPLDLHERYQALEIEGGPVWTRLLVVQPSVVHTPGIVPSDSLIRLRIGSLAGDGDNELAEGWDAPRRTGILWNRPWNLYVELPEHAVLAHRAEIKCIVRDAEDNAKLDGEIKLMRAYSDFEVQRPLKIGSGIYANNEFENWNVADVVAPLGNRIERGGIITLTLGRKRK